MHAVIIVGASHAAAELISSLRKQGWTDSIVLIGDEPLLPYQRPPLSKAYFKDECVAEKLLIRPPSFYQKHQISLKLGERVTRIHRQNNTIELANGERLSYSHLVLATGTRARRLAVPGADSPNINYLRNIQDVDCIKSQLIPNSKLLIVGAGYIGLEIAASAVKQGMQVTVVETMQRVLARVTSPLVSDFFQSVHKHEGVTIRLECTLSEFTQRAGKSMAVTSEGEEIEFDSAVIGIGVLPVTELAESSHLTCENGIKVNQFAQTNDPKIFAIGDCSFHHNRFYDRWIRLESVPNAMEQAKVAAAKICEKDIIYDQLPWFWSDQYDIKLQTAGLFQEHDQVVVRGDQQSRKFAVFYFKDRLLIAVDALNSPAEFMVAKKLIQARKAIDTIKLADTQVPVKELLN